MASLVDLIGNFLLRRFYFDFSPSPTFIGSGMICPHLEKYCSVFSGAIISSGIIWSFLSQHAEN
ncbi:unnamed protein product [Arabidopsis halleri]